MSFLLLFLWIIASLIMGSVVCLLGKRYGVVYPIAVVSALVVMANIFAAKIVVVGPFTVPAGVLVFSLTFFITDILSEVWGKQAAKQAVWAGFGSSLIFVVSLYIVISWPAAAFEAEFSAKFAEVLGTAPRIVAASLLTYLVSQTHDIWAFHWWKRKTNGRYLWLRNNASTIVSQLIDSTLFVTIAFYGVFPILPLIVGQWAVKIIIALIDTPFMYAALALIKKVKPKK